MFRELLVYKKAFSLALEIFKVSKSFPKEEMYSLTDQMRKSSRSVCACIGESYRKRVYPKHFVSKLTDADSENSETIVWLDFALAFDYLEKETYTKLCNQAEEVGKLLNYMMENPDKFVVKS